MQGMFEPTRNMRSRSRWLREVLRRDPTERTLANMAAIFGRMVGEGVITRSVAEGLLMQDARALGLDPSGVPVAIGQGVEDSGKAVLALAASGKGGSERANSGVDDSALDGDGDERGGDEINAHSAYAIGLAINKRKGT